MLRIIFWLALIIAFIPVNKNELDVDQRVVSTSETISLVQSAYYDISQFCTRNPQPCDTGKELASQFGAKAKSGMLLAYNYLDKNFSSGKGQAGKSVEPNQSLFQTDPVTTGSADLN
ncbi:MAG: DUF5330 domain-containing protein [Rhizobiaceae bacterium]